MADLFPVYKDIDGVRIKMVAYKDIDGVRTKISSAEDDGIVGTWILNEHIDTSTNFRVYGNFVSQMTATNGTVYTAYCNSIGNYGGNYYGYVSGKLYYAGIEGTVGPAQYRHVNGGNGWTKEGYRTITITETPTDENFVTWIKANAIRADVITFNVGDNVFTAKSGMTWYEWQHSSYNTNGFMIRETTISGQAIKPIITQTDSADLTVIIEAHGDISCATDVIIAEHKYGLKTVKEGEGFGMIGTWVFNDTVDLDSFPYSNSYSGPNTTTIVKFNFVGYLHTTGGQADYEGIYIVLSDNIKRLVYANLDLDTGDFSSGIMVYSAVNGWPNSPYKTINILSEPTDEKFVLWFKANATKQ